MRIAITGGTGFIGGQLSRRLAAAGHDVVAIGRRMPPTVLPHLGFVGAEADDVDALAAAFTGCEAVVLCAGINRELGDQTYERVHVGAARAALRAAARTGVRRVVLLSFLRARPDCGSRYHESKWAAEELVRASGLVHTIVKPGVVYGRGDHLLDHLSRAFHTFPVFGLVGRRARPIAPLAVDDLAALLAAAATGDRRLANRTVAVIGPEALTLERAVRRVAAVVGRRPVFVPLPVAAHRLIALLAEAAMVVPLVSRAQVRILSEGVVDAAPFAEPPPAGLRPATPFSADAIRAGLPDPGGFGFRDLRLPGLVVNRRPYHRRHDGRPPQPSRP